MIKFPFTEKKDTRSGFGVGLHELGKANSNVVALCADLTGSLKMDAFKKDFPIRQLLDRPCVRPDPPVGSVLR
jgi:transketolase